MYDMHVQTTTANMILETTLEMSIETAKTKCYKKTITGFVNGDIEHEQLYIHVSLKGLYCTAN